MLEKEIIPRLLKLSGENVITKLKTFHSYGVGESRADTMLKDVINLAPNKNVKLGFQAHFPQLETKLFIRASSNEEILENLTPVEKEVRKRLGNYVFAEDKDTLEESILDLLKKTDQSISIVEYLTRGGINSRLSEVDKDGTNLKFAITSNDISVLAKQLGISEDIKSSLEINEKMSSAMRLRNKTDIALSVLINYSEKNEADTYISLSNEKEVKSRVGKFIGDEHRITLGSIEMSLDCLRRYFNKLPFDEKSDFER